MTYRTRMILYRLLPIVFWLLAISGGVIPLVLYYTGVIPLSSVAHRSYLFGIFGAGVTIYLFSLMAHIPRHTSSVNECFKMALLLGMISYGMPTILFLTFPIWIYLIRQNVFSFRAFSSTILGYTILAINAAVGVWLGWISNTWANFFAIDCLWGWIPVGSVIFGYLAATIARQTLRVR